MPRRNAWLLLALIAVCLPCRLRIDRYGAILSYAMTEIERRALSATPPEELFEAAVSGMMDRLKDPHSVYISADEFTRFRQTLDQEFGGVGIEIVLDPDTKQLTVASPLYGTPAFAAGIRPRDRILRIDGKTTQGMSLEDASAVLKGRLGTPVVLLIQHEGEEQPVEVRIVRAKIQVDSVLGDMRRPDGTWQFFLEGHDRIGYVRIHQFGERTVE
ncbi:MAG: PDZ domain-containing protein, partial [Thermoguttaceae bacterium]|nr:PDZ domain-containing protein [Thermoguttaceae bacterium]